MAPVSAIAKQATNWGFKNGRMCKKQRENMARLSMQRKPDFTSNRNYSHLIWIK